MLKDLTIWRRFKDEITESDLLEISNADSGYDNEKHYRNLKKILVSGKLPERLEWEPREVLELVSWNEYWKKEERSCEQANFCSVVLLAASEQRLSNEYLDGQIEKMIIAIDTSKQIGNAWTESLFEFFQYLLPKLNIEEVEEDYLYFNLSLFILAAMLNKPSEQLEAMMSKVINAELTVAEYCQHEVNPDIFSYTCFDQRIDTWRKYHEKYATLLEVQRQNVFANIW